jgi:hypothetical protein
MGVKRKRPDQHQNDAIDPEHTVTALVRDGRLVKKHLNIASLGRLWV